MSTFFLFYNNSNKLLSISIVTLVQFGIKKQCSSETKFNCNIGISLLFRNLSESEVDELYNTGTPKCHEALSTGLKNGLTAMWHLSNWDGAVSG